MKRDIKSNFCIKQVVRQDRSRKKTFSVLTIFLASLLIVMAFVGCGGGSSNSYDELPQPDERVDFSYNTFKSGDEVVIEDSNRFSLNIPNKSVAYDFGIEVTKAICENKSEEEKAVIASGNGLPSEFRLASNIYFINVGKASSIIRFATGGSTVLLQNTATLVFKPFDQDMTDFDYYLATFSDTENWTLVPLTHSSFSNNLYT